MQTVLFFSLAYKYKGSGRLFLYQVPADNVGEANDKVMETISSLNHDIADYELVGYTHSEIPIVEKTINMEIVDSGGGIKGYVSALKLSLDEVEATAAERKSVQGLIKKIEKKYAKK